MVHHVMRLDQRLPTYYSQLTYSTRLRSQLEHLTIYCNKGSGNQSFYSSVFTSTNHGNVSFQFVPRLESNLDSSAFNASILS